MDERNYYTTTAILTCPECETRQHPTIEKLCAGSGGIERVRCKYCGNIFDYSDGFTHKEHVVTDEERAKKRAYDHEYREAHKDEIAAKKHEKGRTPQRIAYEREYYKTHKDAILKRCRTYYQNHKEQTRETVKAWRLANPQKMKTYYYRRSLRLLSDPDDPMHGKMNGYKHGCRCERCIAAQRAYYEEHKDRINELRRAARKRKACTDH